MPISNSNTSFLLVLPWDGTQQLSGIKEAFQPLFEDKQHVEILVFTDLKRPKENFSLPSRIYVISKSDFSLFGKLKSKKLLPTEYTHFDVMILLDVFSGKQEQIIKSLKIKHVVGFNYERDFVEINLIQSQQKPTEKVIFAKQILTKISD
ncbi:hypothetical protein H9Y05_12175 [Crocinitomicaceae bacterium CZZ-1]|uniref:Uncharacterized protein n=1 Tax=Taishania pollutisoli TaxID=2766479 RepID=A0A8J6U2L2_9FLAO|nr:hypothetical protein [Taishania pollutisoli]MBC9813225.1 hypothetical protein [Taishania pollutisoli]